MTVAFAPGYLPGSGAARDAVASALPGVQNLLTLKRARQLYLAEAGAVAIYALVLFGALSYTTKPQEAPPEEPMELVMETPPAPPVEPPKPPEAVKPPPPVEEPPPPPPQAVEPAVAPVKPPPPKPVVKVKPKPAPKPVAKPQPERVVERPRPAIAAPVHAPPAPAGATTSVIVNQIHSCLARAGANLYPESQRPRSATVSYRANISATGSVSYSWGSSGNPAFDSAAQRAGSRCGSVQAPGRPAAASGSISFRS